MIESLKKMFVALCLVAFAFASGPVFAEGQPKAAKPGKQYYVIKDSKGRCSIRQLEKKSPKSIAGPYATKDEAQKAKDKECPKKETSKDKKK